MVENPEPELLEPASRLQGIYGGITVLFVALLLGYFGVRGAIMHLRGSHAAPADPVASVIGIIAGLGRTYCGLRLLLGWREQAALVPNVFLVVGGAGAVAGGAWFISINHSLHGSLWRDFPYGYWLAFYS
jgi:hypothetical protein